MHSITTFPIMFAFAYFDAIFFIIENNSAHITPLLYCRMKQYTALVGINNRTRIIEERDVFFKILKVYKEIQFRSLSKNEIHDFQSIIIYKSIWH